MKKLFLLLVICILGSKSFAYEIAFPQEKELIISQDGIFFIGKLDKKEDLWINNQKIIPNKNSSFAITFKLQMGENIFDITSSKNELKERYIITRTRQIDTASEYKRFDATDYKTIIENAILRATPIDFGMNRLGYLPKGTDLEIIGTKNEFSQVYLNEKKSAWIMTKHIAPEQREITVEGEYRGETIQEDAYSTTRRYRFSKNLPYSVIYKNGFLYVDVFNVENRPYQTYHTEISLSCPYCYSSKMVDNELIIEIPNIDLTKKNIKIVVDPGHGGKESGAIGCFSDYEKDLNLKAARMLYKELKSQGYKVFITRRDDKFLSLNDRIEFSKNKKAIIFVSLHMNSVPESSNPNEHKGSGTYYYTEFSKLLAESVQSELVNTLGTKDNGIFQASFAVIRPTEYVGVLVETAYMVNPEDAELYKSKDFFKKVAVGISNGIKKYLTEL